jgi:hypothetical protein
MLAITLTAPPHCSQVSISMELLNLYTLDKFNMLYSKCRKDVNENLRDIYQEKMFHSSKDIQHYMMGVILI